MSDESERELIEKLAAIEHQRWSCWHEHSVANWVPENIERWNRLALLRYDELPEFSKDSDRKEVMKYWPLVKEAIRAAEERERKRCAEIAQRHGCVPCNGAMGALEADCIYDEILKSPSEGTVK